MTVPMVHDPSGRHARNRMLFTIRTFDTSPEESNALTRLMPRPPR